VLISPSGRSSRFVDLQTNEDPKPFVWTGDPGRIIASVKRVTKLYCAQNLALRRAAVPDTAGYALERQKTARFSHPTLIGRRRAVARDRGKTRHVT
jgi:hypothetical protein